MADDNQRRYAAIVGLMVGSLRSPWGARVRFLRGEDDGRDGSAYLLAVAVGVETSDGDAEVMGALFYADGAADTEPKPVLAEQRQALLVGVGLAV